MKTKSVPKIILVSASILVAVFLMIYLYFIYAAPHREYQAMQENAYSDSAFIQEFNKYSGTPATDSLLRVKAHKEALLSLSASDSIGLIVNLQDSSATLCFRGVAIHTSRIRSIQIDEILKGMELAVYCNLFSASKWAEATYSSVVKEPIIIKQAPKDTIEAANSVYLPDTLKKEPAFITFLLDNQVRLNIEQIERSGDEIKKIKRAYFLRQKYNEFGLNIRNIFSLKNPPYTPKLRIILAGDDVRTIYRALPNRARIVILF
jgi:hypothetical protein